ncbi:MAG TPA: regulatory signaling modulator protein AmpE [Cellvibrionaceae bacterium]
MVFLAVLLALSGLQLFTYHPLANRWVHRTIERNPSEMACMFWVLIPILLTALSYRWLDAHFWLLALLFSAGILWLCIGSSAHKRALENFINAGRAENWGEALNAYKQIQGDKLIAAGDWAGLNKAMLERVAYENFSQLFATLFWFCVAGPAGALGYRLTCICGEVQPQPRLMRLIWLLEWPAVRLLGLTFAFTGNFLNCFQRWQACVLCRTRSSAQMISHYVLGALGVSDDNEARLEVTRRELLAMSRLLRRSLWFWVGLLAVAALKGW